MRISVLVAQFPIRHSVAANLREIEGVLNQVHPGDLVVLPEGALSGYSDDLSFLDSLDPSEVSAALDTLAAEAASREVHIWLGACQREGAKWRNTGVGLTPYGERHTYRKVNLATHERGVFDPGGELCVFDLQIGGDTVRIGVQLCRDLRYPEQWAYLARRGAQVILHLNNAKGVPQARRVWSSQLISRAVDTQRWVVSANTASADQNCPSIVVAPDGEVLAEVVSHRAEVVRLELDLSLVSDWYLSQARTDLTAPGPAAVPS